MVAISPRMRKIEGDFVRIVRPRHWQGRIPSEPLSRVPLSATMSPSHLKTSCSMSQTPNNATMSELKIRTRGNLRTNGGRWKYYVLMSRRDFFDFLSHGEAAQIIPFANLLLQRPLLWEIIIIPVFYGRCRGYFDVVRIMLFRRVFRGKTRKQFRFRNRPIIKKKRSSLCKKWMNRSP